MKIISGLFDTHEEASKAVDALKDAGIASNDISVVGPDGKTDASGAAEGAGIGAAVGGVGGLLAGLGALRSRALVRSLARAGLWRRLLAWRRVASPVVWWDR